VLFAARDITIPQDLLPPGLSALLDRLDAASRKMLSGTLPGERRSKRRGRSVEFDDFRDYAAGDDLRHIDWNIYARLDRLVIKLFREEEDLALNIAVDCSPSMNAGDPNKLLYAHQLAFALSYFGLVNHNRVSVATFAPAQGLPITQLRPMRGRRNVSVINAHLRESLANAARPFSGIAPGADVPAQTFNRAMQLFASTTARRGLNIVISDFLSPHLSDIDPGLGYLGAGSMSGMTDTYCLQVLAPDELDPTTAAAAPGATLNGDLRLTDIETAAAVEVTITPDSIAAYKRRFEAARTALRAACSMRGMAHVVIPTSTPLSDLLLNTLRRSGMLT
jgi:uncharacterized protein (DUF58 family)